LTALLEDIFEAEDALPPDVDIQALPAEWFSPMTVDGSSPLLHPNIIRKLAKYIGQVTRPTKRIRLSAREGAPGGGGTPRGKGRMAEVDTAILSRVLKILDRSVLTGEDLDPFHFVASDRNVSPRKPKKPTKRPKAKEGEGDEDDEAEKGDMAVDEPPLPPQEATEATDVDLEHLTKILEVAKDSVLAADCCIALLGSDRLTKQVCSPLFLF
jgi:cohesin loading factor subunit SCC2